jgi:AcrR family transcriptional regulator
MTLRPGQDPAQGSEASDASPASARRRRTRNQGRAKAADILSAARGLLADTYCAQFTLRNVADRAGVRLGHLQYYFPTKGDLVRALFASVAEVYRAQTERVLAQVPDTPTARFMAWIDFLLEDCWDPRTRHFFIQLWGLLESEDAYTGRLLREFYQTDIGEIVRLLEALSPHLDAGLLRQLATIIAGVIEGMMLMVESGPAEDSKALLNETRKQIFRIATEA